MVFDDLSFSNLRDSSEGSNFKTAPVHDRLMASVFDMVLFAPVVSLLLFSLFQKIQLMAWVAPKSTEFSVYLLIAGIFVFFLSSLLHALFLLIWQATPGMKIMKLRVEALHGRITLSVALLRGFSWSFGVLLLGLPFLEILSHPQRRAFHDRVSDTQVVTLKQVADRGPHPYEALFIRKVLILTSLTVLMWSISLIGKFYGMAVEGVFKEQELLESDYLCKDKGLESEKGYSRLEKAIALYWAGSLSADCLWTEADFALWKSGSENRAWAYLAKAIVEQDLDKRSDYIKEVCTGDHSKVCEIAQAWDVGEVPNSSHLLGHVLGLEKKIDLELPMNYEKDIRSLQQFSGMDSFATKARIVDLWQNGLRERAEGVFEGFGPLFSEKEKNQLLTFMCLKDRDESCSSRKSMYCDILSQRLEWKAEEPSKEATFAVIKDHVCRNDQYVHRKFSSVFKRDPILKDWVGAVLPGSGKSIESRIHTLKNLAHQSGISDELRKQFLLSWLELSKNSDHLEGFVKSLESFPSQGGKFEFLYVKALQNGLELKERDFVKSLLSLRTPDHFKPQSQIAKVKAHYEVDDREGGQLLLKALSPGLRAPASDQAELRAEDNQ